MNQVAQTAPKSPLVAFKGDLRRLKNAGELALPSTVKFEAFENALVVAITDNPKILQCSQESIFKAVRTLAHVGLVPDGREAAIVPFGPEAQAMPMVAGLVKVARNSGKITSLWSDVVYEGETLEVWVENGERKWDHVLEDGSKLNAMKRGGEIIGAYAVATLSDGTVEFQPMTKDEIEKRRKVSKTQKGAAPDGIWGKWYDEMAKKTVIRNLCKRLPMSSEDMDRILKEQDPIELKDVTPEDDKPRQNLAQRLTGAADPMDQTPEAEPEDDNQDIEGTVAAEFDHGAVDMSTDEFTEGVKAKQAALKEEHNPHKPGTPAWNNWLGGFKEAEGAA